MGDRLGILGAVGLFYVARRFWHISIISGIFENIIMPTEQLKCLRPYHAEHTSSRSITKVKQHRAKLVLGWVTTWEYLVL